MGTSKKPGIFRECKEATRGKPECMGEYMRAHGAKSIKFVRAEGCGHGADAAIEEINGF